MKKQSIFLSILLTVIFFAASFSLYGCKEEKYRLAVVGSELLYEELEDSFSAYEEVTVKVKITPDKNTVAYLDGVQLVRTKSTQNDFYTFTFTMPQRTAYLIIENETYFDEALLTGFYLTFSDKSGNPIDSLNKDFGSPEAVAWYYYTYSDEFGKEVITSNDHADVFGNGKATESMNMALGLEKIELESTLCYTYELLDAVACVDWVYFDPHSKDLSLSDGSESISFMLDDTGIWSTSRSQNLSETRYSSFDEEYQATFDSQIKINFEYIDYLTGVKILEYDKNNQLIKTSDFTGNNRSETFTVGENCEYAVIEEEFTVMSGDEKDEKHYERTLIDKSETARGKTLNYPRGDGLISPVRLSVVF